MKPDIDLLRPLREDVNALLEEAHHIARNKDLDGLGSAAINWGDLRCVRSEYALGDDETIIVRVYIEEADPQCSALHNFIQGALNERWGAVEVVTNW